MPAGVPRAPGAGPLHDVLRGGVLPEGKVCRMAFAFVYLNPGAGPEVIQALAGELAVVF